MGNRAFGWPGADPTWSSSDKDFVTTALGSSRPWATVGHGIVNEVYWPSTGTPQIRVTDTLKVASQMLRMQAPSGGLYHRYYEYGYGEYGGTDHCVL